jgi:outer membrane biosynthesis protein TonB
MRLGAILSGLLHLAILLLVLFGLPDLFKQDEEIAAPIAVQLATLSDITSTPHPTPQSQPKPATKPTPPPPAPKAPEPPPSAEPQAQPTPQQQPVEKVPPAPQTPPTPPPPTPPQPQTVETPPPEAAEPIAIPEKPKPQPPQEAKVEPPPAPILRPNTPQKPKPQKKPTPPQTADFSSLLKNLTKQQPQPSAEAPIQPQPDQPDTASISALSSPQLSMGEIDALRSQISGCWYIDPGHKGGEDMIVDVHVNLAPDGSVQHAQIEDTARMGTDAYYRAAAEAALRAVYKCSPLNVPPGKYDTWKDLHLHFNPSGMLG